MYDLVRSDVCWCLWFNVYGGNYGVRNSVLTMWLVMIFYVHVSEALEVLAQESQSPPRYFILGPELLFGLWYNSLQLFIHTQYETVLFHLLIFVIERVVCACALIFDWSHIFPAPHRKTGNTDHLWQRNYVRLGNTNKNPKSMLPACKWCCRTFSAHPKTCATETVLKAILISLCNVSGTACTNFKVLMMGI